MSAWRGEVEDGSGWGGLLPTREEREEEKRRAKVRELQRDSARLEWLMHIVSGAEFRRIGVNYSAGCDRAAIDAAMTKGA